MTEINKKLDLAAIPPTNNDGDPYILPLDIYKEGYQAYNISNWFKGRVGDNGTPFAIRWYSHGRLLNIQGMRPFIEGQVGDYTIDDSDPDNPQITMAEDASNIHIVGDVDDTQAGGVAIYRLINQAFPKSGIFYGKIGFMGTQDDGTLVNTGVDIVFKVLAGHMNMLGARKFYVSELEKAWLDLQAKIKQYNSDYKNATQQQAEQFKEDTENALADLNTKIANEIKRAEDTLGDTQASIDSNIASLKKVAASVGALMAQIDANDIVKKTDFDAETKALSDHQDALSKSITDKLANIDLKPEFLANLDAVKAKYPDGKDGYVVLQDSGSAAYFEDGTWKTGSQITLGNGLIANIWNKNSLVAPYDDLNQLPTNTVNLYVSDGISVKNMPDNLPSDAIGYSVLTIGPTQIPGGNFQLFKVFGYSQYFTRMSWGGNHEAKVIWDSWQANDGNHITAFIAEEDVNTTPFKDLNNLPSESTISYANTSLFNNLPWGTSPFTIKTFGKGFPDEQNQNQKSLQVQVAFVRAATIRTWIRMSTGHHDFHFSPWIPLDKSWFIDSNAPSQNIDKLPSLSAVTLMNAKNAISENAIPWDNSLSFTIFAFGRGNNGQNGELFSEIKAFQTQIAVVQNSEMYIRFAMFIGDDDKGNHIFKFDDWKKVPTIEPKHQYLPSLSIFDKFTVLGDSYSAGLIASKDKSQKNTDSRFKWGSFIAKKYGTTFTSLSVSGQSSQSFVKNNMDKLQANPLQDIYYITLGINDSKTWANTTLGKIDDVHQNFADNPDTFYGNYAKIIGAIKDHDPKTRILLFTIMSDWGRRADFDKAIKEIGNWYSIPVINVLDDPYFSSDEFKALQHDNHPTAVGYGILAERMEKLIQKCVIDNQAYFEDYGF